MKPVQKNETSLKFQTGSKKFIGRILSFFSLILTSSVIDHFIYYYYYHYLLHEIVLWQNSLEPREEPSPR